MKTLICAFGIICAGLTVQAGVLYWQVSSPVTVNDGGDNFTVTSTTDWTHARVVAHNGSGEAVYYPFLTPSEDPTYSTTAPGTPVASTIATDGVYAILPSDSPYSSYSYYIELGNYESSTFNAKYQSTAFNWTENASSVAITTSSFDALTSATLRGLVAWSGGTYHSVPEPTGGMLVLIGLSLLSLRRRTA